MYYQLTETLIESTQADCLNNSVPFIAVLTPEEWKSDRDRFGLELDMELDANPHKITKAESNYNSITGSLSFIDMSNIGGTHSFATFVIYDKGIIFVDHDGYTADSIARLQRTRKWRYPCPERFLYDFLAYTIADDLSILEAIEARMDEIEQRILANTELEQPHEIHQIRNDLLDLRSYYNQLINLAEELEDNELNLFEENNLRFFHLFGDRVDRPQNIVQSLRDSSTQLLDLQKSQMDIKKNRIATVLTIFSTMFFPLSLITGWYGMNFKNMPELDHPMAYPIIIVVSLCIIAANLIYMKIKKWL